MFKKKKQNLPARNPSRMRQPTLERNLGTSVFSYHANRTARPGPARRQEQPPAQDVRAKRNLRAVLFKRGRIATALITIVVALTLNLFLGRTPSVTTLSTPKNEVFLQDDPIYQAAATDALRRSIWNGNKLTINTVAIEKDLRARFPELQYVDVSVPFAGHTVRVHIEPATPQLLLSAGNDVYVLDTAGRAVIKANEARRVEKLGLPVVTDESGLPVEVGKPALPSTSVAFITEVVSQLRAKKIDISSLTLPAGTSELHVRANGVPYYVRFNLQGHAREEAGTFLAVKAQLEREKKTPDTYIDVRVEERAYYR